MCLLAEVVELKEKNSALQVAEKEARVAQARAEAEMEATKASLADKLKIAEMQAKLQAAAAEHSAYKEGLDRMCKLDARYRLSGASSGRCTVNC